MAKFQQVKHGEQLNRNVARQPTTEPPNLDATKPSLEKVTAEVDPTTEIVTTFDKPSTQPGTASSSIQPTSTTSSKGAAKKSPTRKSEVALVSTKTS